MNVILFVVCFFYDIKILVRCGVGMEKESFNYEKQNNYGLGHRPIENYRRAAEENRKHGSFFDSNQKPKPLPEEPSQYFPTPYQSIYQGARQPGDKRVYNYKFDYDPKQLGHQISANGLFNCIITHLAVESAGGTPILLRGGANYRFFTIIVKAKAGVALQGRIRAFCHQPPEGINVNANVDMKRR